MRTLLRHAAWLGTVLALLAGCGGGGGETTPSAGGGRESPAFAEGVVALGSSESTVSLGWAPVAGAGGYAVERRAGDGAWTPVATLDAEARHHLDEGLQRATRYSYRVRALGTGQQAEIAASTGEESVLVTALGAPSGDAVERRIGGAGGTLAAADGRVTVQVPASALAAETTLRLQPIANTAPDGIADGVLLQIGAVPSRALQLTLRYPEASAPDADGLGVALQRADGSWLALPVRALDKATRSLTVALDGRLHSGPATAPGFAPAAASVTLDFRVVLYRNFFLAPRQATLKVGETRVFVPYSYTRGVIGTVCVPDPNYGCVPMPLIGSQTLAFDNVKAGYDRRWYVFAQEGGDAGSGTITPRAGAGATYRAPARVPDVNPVLVSFVSTHQASGRRVTVTASVTVKEPVWTGIARGTLSAPGGDLAFTFAIEAVWTADPQGDGSRFVANGTQTVHVIEITCTGTATPSSAPLPPGALVIDASANPPRYTLDAGSVWRTVVAGHCPGHGSGSVAFDVPGRLVVEGTVGGDGTSISGQQVLGGVAWDWALTSQL